MATFQGGIDSGPVGTQFAYGTRIAAHHARVRRALTFEDNLEIDDVPPMCASNLTYFDHVQALPIATFKGCVEDRTTLAFDFFEKFHVEPSSVALGNVLSDQTVDFTIYSAFRTDTQDWTAFTNNAGTGTTMSGLPALPLTFQPQTDGNLSLQLQVSDTGQATVDSTLVFSFATVPQTVTVPITLDRVVLFAQAPEIPYTERLRFLTEVMRHIDGTEQRISARKSPRQLFEWNYILDDGEEANYIHNQLFEWQDKVFGIPMWHDMTTVTQAVTATDTVINVAETDYRDFRTGGLFVVLTDRKTFDVLELDSLTSTTLTATSEVANAYPVGTKVMPLRTAVLERLVAGSRFIPGDAKLTLRFRVTDNDVDLADTSAWSSYNSKVLIDGCNSVRGEMSEQFERDIVLFDSGSGLTTQSSPWANGKRITQLGLLAQSPSTRWDVRQLVYALRGRQVSFYVASFLKDLEPDGDMAAATTLNVKNVGYTRFVNARQPKDEIMITFNDGTAAITRTILSSAVFDEDREVLTVDTVLPAKTEATIDKIMFLEKVRADSDEIVFRHEASERSTRTTMPVKSVFE
jgi:hypothetical protein